MDLVDGMRVFVAAVETGSFAGAARRLGMSNKLASKYLGELEDQLGTRLLQRTTRKLGMTAAGEQLFARAPDWLDQLDEMTDGLREDGGGLSGTLRISAPLTFGELYVQEMLRRFGAPHPDLTVDLRLSDSFVDLAAQGIDVAIRIGILADSALIARKLGETALLPVASPGYLAKHGRPARPEDLLDHDCIRDTNQRVSGSWWLTDTAGPRQIPVGGRFMVNSGRAARDLAAAGEGIALCPDYIVRDDLTQGRLERILPSCTGQRLDIHAVHLGGRRIARRVRAFLDFTARNLPADFS